MSTIDEKVVELKFNNSQFAAEIKATLLQLENLKRGLKLEGASKGLTDVQNAANRMNLAHIADGVQNISKHFTALGIAATAALASIAVQAVRTGAQLLKSLTLQPVMDGLHEYETNLNSIQTIMANTGLEGQAGLNQVNKALNDLNLYSDKTIYNFSQMARNIGTFTAAGVKLEPATQAIKGIANLAAISGSSAEQASSAMYQLSQAMASGTVKLIDWNSVVNAGMGGKVFQESLKETARAHGVAVDQIIKDEGSFRESLQSGWLTSDVLTETLQKFTGDLNASQLKTMGYTDQQIAGIMKMGKTAQEAATKVKTVSQLISTLQEAMGSGWAQTFQIVFGDFEEARTLFTNVSNTLGGMIQESAKARNKVLGDWKKLGGRKVLIDGISIAFQNLMDIITPIKKAFHDIFPPATGQSLLRLTQGFKDFMLVLRPSETTMDNLRRTFRGVFAVVDILGQVIGGVIKFLVGLGGAAGVGSGGILNFTGNIGDFLVRIDEMLKKGHGVEKFFSGLHNIITPVIEAVKAVARFIGDMFSGFDSSNVEAAFGRVQDRLNPLETLAKGIATAFHNLIIFLGKVGAIVAPFIQKYVDAFKNLGNAIAEGFSSGNFSHVLDAINTGLLAGILLLIKKFMSNGINVDLGGGMFGQIKEMFGTLTGSMKAMQTQIKAKTLLLIAGAIALLTASVVALSLIDSDRLTKALGAMAVGFGELLASMAVLVKVSGSAGFVKIPLISASLILLAGAIDLLVLAVIGLSRLSWEELAKGLIGVGALLLQLSIATKPLGANAGGMIRAGIGITALAVGLNILALAVKQFGNMDWGVIGKGLVGVAGGLLVIAGAMQLMPTGMILQSVALIAIGAALKVIASALNDFGTLDWGVIGKGLTAMAGALVIIVAAMNLLPPSLPLTAAGLVLVSLALQGIGSALVKMGGMSWKEIGKGLVTLAGALAILAAGLYAMSGTLAGSAALLVASAALGILAPVMVILGSMSWESIAKGMVTLAGAFTILGLAGLILTPLVPSIIGLGLALLALGAGLALAGAGALAFATAFGIVVAAGSAGVSVLTAILGVIIATIPQALRAFALGLVQFALVISQSAPAFVKAFQAILDALLTAIITVTPKIAKALNTMLAAGLLVLNNNIPRLVQAGFNLLLGLLRGISNNIGRIVQVVGDIIVKFLNALAQQLPRIVDAGAKLIIAFINALSRAIDNNSAALGAAGGRLGVAIIKGIARGILGGVGEIASAAKEAAKSALTAAKNFLHINSPSRLFRDQVGMPIAQGMAVGIEAAGQAVEKAGVNVIKNAMSTMQDAVKTDIDLTPTIAPVIDLTQFRKDASQISSTIAAQQVKAVVSTTSAEGISAQQAAALAEIAATTPVTEAAAPVWQFEQNNYSPKALTPAEIYRQTKNQLSVVKGALA